MRIRTRYYDREYQVTSDINSSFYGCSRAGGDVRIIVEGTVSEITDTVIAKIIEKREKEEIKRELERLQREALPSDEFDSRDGESLAIWKNGKYDEYFVPVADILLMQVFDGTLSDQPDNFCLTFNSKGVEQTEGKLRSYHKDLVAELNL
jgi:hypothetical protein